VPFFWRLNRFWEGYKLAIAEKLTHIICKHRIDVIESPEIWADVVWFSLQPLKKKPPLVVKLHTPSQSIDELSNRRANFSRRIDYLFEWNDEYGTFFLEGTNIPFFFSSMFTGQRALDNGSFERLIWHIKFENFSEFMMKNDVIVNKDIPCGDGGICYGQAYLSNMN